MPVHISNFPLCKFWFGLVTGIFSRQPKRKKGVNHVGVVWFCLQGQISYLPTPYVRYFSPRFTPVRQNLDVVLGI